METAFVDAGINFAKRSIGLGDAGASNDDESYTGETGDSATSVQYYRNKITEFQTTLNAFDDALTSANNLLAAGDISEELRADLQQMLIDAEGKRVQMRTVAETINAGVAGINALGGRMPELSIPSGLGFVPVLIPAAMAAAVAAVASLGYFAAQWIKGYNERLRREQLITSAANPAQQAAIVQGIAESDNAIATIESQGIFGGSSFVTNLVKWGAVAAVAYFAWQAYEKHSKG